YLLGFSSGARAQEVQAPSTGTGPLSGRWTVTADFHGTPIYFNLELIQQGDKLTGTLDGDKLAGSVTGSSIQFQTKQDDGGTVDTKATLKDRVISGTFVFTGGDDPSRKETNTFTAIRVPARRAGTPRRHEFTAIIFYRRFSPENQPVLAVAPGDTIHTTTVDA